MEINAHRRTQWHLRMLWPYTLEKNVCHPSNRACKGHQLPGALVPSEGFPDEALRIRRRSAACCGNGA